MRRVNCLTVCEHTSTGNWWCDEQACRTRWLVGTTTEEPYRPSTVPSLILDILETWCGTWFTPTQIVELACQIRPDIDPWRTRIGAGRIRENGGGWVDDGRSRPEEKKWVTVESCPDPLSHSTDYGFSLMVRHRTY